MMNLFSFIFYFIRWISWNRIIISFVVTLYSFCNGTSIDGSIFFFLSFNTNYLMMKIFTKKKKKKKSFAITYTWKFKAKVLPYLEPVGPNTGLFD